MRVTAALETLAERAVCITARPVMSAQVWAIDTEPPDGSDYMPTQPELLRRVLDGLRKLG